jgi:hypothetical protein
MERPPASWKDAGEGEGSVGKAFDDVREGMWTCGSKEEVEMWW